MSNLKIKALIVLQGNSISNIAREIGVSREWVSKVVNGRKNSKRIRKAIARALDKPIEELWPNNNKAA